MTKLPLEGVRVVDMTVVWAGPHVTQLLAEWGAEVIRVEPLQHVQPSTRGAENPTSREQIQAMRAQGLRGGYGYPDNDPGARPFNRFPIFQSHGRNKLSMTCDIMFPDGLEVFKRLVAVSDVVVENNVPETIEKAGVTYEELVKVNPQLIMLRMPAYGLSGPYKNYRSLGSHMEGMTGHHLLRSYPELDPNMTGDIFFADASAGVLGAFAVVTALHHRRLTGEGQQIEMAQSENFMTYIAEFILDYTMNVRVVGPQGNSHPSHAPHNVYPCRGEDNWLVIDVGSEEDWQALCSAMGNPEWCTDERFANPVSRHHNSREMDGLISEWTREQDKFELFHHLQGQGVPAGPVQDERDVHACPHLNERGFFQELTSPDAGTHRYPGLNFKMARTPNKLRRHPVCLGEDNEYVYREVLGVSDEEYAKLEGLGHIGTDYPHLRSPERAG